MTAVLGIYLAQFRQRAWLWWLIALAAALLAWPVQAQPTILSGKTELSAKKAGCEHQQNDYVPINQRYERGLIFRLEKCGYSGNYVMGTMHSDSPRLLPIYNDAIAIIGGMKTVGFEFVEDERTLSVAMKYMYFPPAQPRGLLDLLGEETFERLARAMQSRLQFPRETVNRLRPWAAAIMLQYPVSTSDGVVLDMRLQHHARELDKQLVSLETPAEQFSIFDDIPLDKQLVMLRDTVADIEQLDASNSAFMHAYINRDLHALHALADDSFAMTRDVALRNYIEDKLLIRRNRIMATRMLGHLNRGDALFAIGALHLLGEKGVLAHLERAGWRIEVVR